MQVGGGVILLGEPIDDPTLLPNNILDGKGFIHLLVLFLLLRCQRNEFHEVTKLERKPDAFN